jgi:hypothetical protein
VQRDAGFRRTVHRVRRPTVIRWLLVVGAMMVGGVGCGSAPAADVSGRMDFPMSTFGGMNRISQGALPDPAALPFDALERFGDTTYQLIVIGPDATLSPDTATRVAREAAAGFNPAAASTQ